LLDEYRLDGRYLQVELTEQVLMHDIKVCQRVLLQLRARGVRVAIDDFGTGYSSLAYLKQLRIDNLKIDRSFTCATSPATDQRLRDRRGGDRPGPHLGLEAVAEGSSTIDQERFSACGRLPDGRRGIALPNRCRGPELPTLLTVLPARAAPRASRRNGRPGGYRCARRVVA